MNNEKPYIKTERVVVEYQYNPNYGDDRMCICGHPYHRHFDSYEDMTPVGCKYCKCDEFKEETEKDIIHVSYLMSITNYKTEEPLKEYLDFVKNTKFSGRLVEGVIKAELTALNFSNVKDYILKCGEQSEYTYLVTDLSYMPYIKFNLIKGKKFRINGKVVSF